MSAPLRCPKCSCPLESVKLPEGVRVESCPHCFGAFYDRSELAVAVALEGAMDTNWACPKCGGPLKTGRYRGQLELEQCGRCPGLWFDSGEIHKLRKLSGVEGIVKGTEAAPASTPIMPPMAAAAFANKLENLRERIRTPERDARPSHAEGKAPLFPEIPDGSGLPNPDEQQCPTAEYQGRIYKHFQTSAPVVTYVVGEFPWQVKVGEKARARDFICPPFILSQETSGKESVWSHGEYIEPQEIWAAFQLPDSPPERRGVAPAQPNPHEEGWPALSKAFWTFSVVALGVALTLGFSAENKTVLERGFAYNPAAAEKSVVTEEFELGGHNSNVEVAVNANLNNQWAYLSMALINAETDTAMDFGREVAFYSGSDEDGMWREGSPSDSVILPRVAPGRYYLRIEPATDSGAFTYSVRLRRDVPQPSLLLTALVLLTLPVFWAWWRRRTFEQQRWAESDHPWSSLNGDDDGDDDDDDDEFYPIYGATVVAAMAWACYVGWSWTSVDEVKSVPKSVRDNPGSYRAHYLSHTRYYGGK